MTWSMRRFRPIVDASVVPVLAEPWQTPTLSRRRNRAARSPNERRRKGRGMDMVLYVLLALPVVLLVGAAAIVRRYFGSTWMRAFVGFTASLMAVNMIVGWHEANRYLATGGWTAATLTPFFYWMEGSLVTIGSLVLWLFGLGLFTRWKRRSRSQRRDPI